MRNTIRMTPMRGFTCAVGRTEDGTAGIPAGGISIGVDSASGEDMVAIAIRHPDGTVLTASLSEQSADRFESVLAAARAHDVPVCEAGWLK